MPRPRVQSPPPYPLMPPPPSPPPPLQLDREKQAEAVLQELAGIISRYRGPLLESSVDLEQRLWHLATMTGEVGGALWGKGGGGAAIRAAQGVCGLSALCVLLKASRMVCCGCPDDPTTHSTAQGPLGSSAGAR